MRINEFYKNLEKYVFIQYKFLKFINDQKKIFPLNVLTTIFLNILFP
jgi:hypothetical protein